MKKALLSLIVAFPTLPAAAQNWTKETLKAFKQEKKAALVVNLKAATIMDVSYEDYPEYYSGKFSSNEKYANLLLEKFENRFRNGFFKSTKKEIVPTGEARFTVVYDFREITEKGGFSGTYYLMDGEDKSNILSFAQEDGRWNDFETLLMENIDEFWKTKKRWRMGGNPVYDGYYLIKEIKE